MAEKITGVKEVCPIHSRQLDSDGTCRECRGVPKKEDILARIMLDFKREAQVFQQRIEWYSDQIDKTMKNKTWR